MIKLIRYSLPVRLIQPPESTSTVVAASNETQRPKPPIATKPGWQHLLAFFRIPIKIRLTEGNQDELIKKSEDLTRAIQAGQFELILKSATTYTPSQKKMSELGLDSFLARPLWLVCGQAIITPKDTHNSDIFSVIYQVVEDSRTLKIEEDDLYSYQEKITFNFKHGRSIVCRGSAGFKDSFVPAFKKLNLFLAGIYEKENDKRWKKLDADWELEKQRTAESQQGVVETISTSRI